MSDPETTSSSDDGVFYLCRVGTIYLIAPKGEEIATQVEEVKKRLEEDTRVLWVERSSRSADFTRRFYVYPTARQSEPDEILHGTDAMSAVDFDRPLIFKVVVPIKNQPKHHEADDIPTDTYWIAWNGIVAMVLWEQNSDTIPRSGGHVALKVMEDAARNAGYDVYNQACSPACSNVFMHSDLIIQTDPSVSECTIEDASGTTVYVTAPEREDEATLLRRVFFDFHNACETFARQKNIGRRIMDLEVEAWGKVSHLLSHYSTHAETTSLPLLKSLSSRWRNRGWRAEVRALSAQAWISMTGIEILLREWKREKGRFLDEAREIMPVFQTDYVEDDRRVGATDLSKLESLSSQVESRLDNRLVSFATAGGAISGALMGAMITLLGG